MYKKALAKLTELPEAVVRSMVKYGVIITSDDPLLVGTVALAVFHLDCELSVMVVVYTNRDLLKYNVRIRAFDDWLPCVPEAQMYPIWMIEDLYRRIGGRP